MTHDKTFLPIRNMIPQSNGWNPKKWVAKGSMFLLLGVLFSGEPSWFSRVYDPSRETYSYSLPWNLSLHDLHDSHKSHSWGNHVNSPWQFLNPLWCGLVEISWTWGLHNNWSTWTYLIYCDLDFGATNKRHFITKVNCLYWTSHEHVATCQKIWATRGRSWNRCFQEPSSSHHTSLKKGNLKQKMLLFVFLIFSQLPSFKLERYKVGINPWATCWMSVDSAWGMATVHLLLL